MERVSFITIAALVAFSGSINGQVCAGFASFATRPLRVSGSAGFNDNAKSFSGGFGFGGQAGFGEVTLGTASSDDFDGSSFLYGGGAGYDVGLGEKGLFHLCPKASLEFASGPNNVDIFGSGSLFVDLSETDFSFGVGLGLLGSQSNQTQIIPNVSLNIVTSTLKAHDDVSGFSDSNRETFGLLGLGLGFVFNEAVSLHPSVSIPFSLDNASTTFGVTLGVNFGGKPRTQ